MPVRTPRRRECESGARRPASSTAHGCGAQRLDPGSCPMRPRQYRITSNSCALPTPRDGVAGRTQHLFACSAGVLPSASAMSAASSVPAPASRTNEKRDLRGREHTQAAVGARCDGRLAMVSARRSAHLDDGTAARTRGGRQPQWPGPRPPEEAGVHGHFEGARRSAPQTVRPRRKAAAPTARPVPRPRHKAPGSRRQRPPQCGVTRTERGAHRQLARGAPNERESGSRRSSTQ